MIATAGCWDPLEGKLIFAAGAAQSQFALFTQPGTSKHSSMLELILSNSKRVSKLFSLLDFPFSGWQERIQEAIEYHRHTFLDSGVFTLAMNHAKRYGVSHNDALNTPVQQLDGWQAHYDWYVKVCQQAGDRLWGYVELDLGGTEQKMKTRASLEAQGLRPMPVWHPLTDGMEYGEHLMKTYDRICLGNLVKSDERTRKAVLRVMAHVKGSRPVWVHALGLANVPFAQAFPINSLDAMTWMAPMMYAKRMTYACLHKEDRDAPRFYDAREDYPIAFAILQRQIVINQQNWRAYDEAKRRAY